MKSSDIYCHLGYCLEFVLLDPRGVLHCYALGTFVGAIVSSRSQRGSFAAGKFAVGTSAGSLSAWAFLCLKSQKVQLTVL
jgi:hypothetical protein